MNKVKVLVSLVFLLMVLSSDANACSCASGGKPCHDYWKATAVFTGTVIYKSSTTYKLGEYDVAARLIRFNIDRAFRGVKGKEVEVRTGLGDSDCGYNFRLGGQYLVYAYDAGDNLATGICSRTRPISEASDDLAYFQGLATAEPGATISGEVKRLDQAARWEERLQPVSDARIVIEGPSMRVEAITDKKGNYRVSGLAPNTYKVRVELPEGLSIHNPEQEARVFDRGCAQISFWVETDTRVRGKVFDAQGQPAADVLMELVPVEGQDNGYPTTVTTDKEGGYEMKLVRPGRYFFGVRIYGLAGSTYMPFPRTYYPGVREADRAAIITVVEGQRIDLNDLILPPRFVERILNGVVVDTEGRPVSGATVWLKENEYQDRDMPYRKETDSEGRFSFKVFEGINYNLRAYLDTDKAERKQAEHSIRIAPDAEIIRLILK
jgi:protocatechuate 3,4-dioxygenase beta subunit